MGFLTRFAERRMRKRAVAGADLLAAYTVSFDTEGHAAVAVDWLDWLTPPERDYVEAYAAIAYAAKQAWNLTDEDSADLLNDLAAAGPGALYNSQVVAYLPEPASAYHADVYAHPDGEPFIQTPAEGYGTDVGLHAREATGVLLGTIA